MWTHGRQITCHAMYSHWLNSSNFFSLASISSSVALLPDGVIGTPSWISKSLGCLAVPLTCQISLQDPIVVWVLDLYLTQLEPSSHSLGIANGVLVGVIMLSVVLGLIKSVENIPQEAANKHISVLGKILRYD